MRFRTGKGEYFDKMLLENWEYILLAIAVLILIFLGVYFWIRHDCDKPMAEVEDGDDNYSRT